ncbi:vWA domain-containing protein [Maribacter antarcticus]|uniref:vWA domain-containing protein n=1 Tax=Maribacter antarcticus TaxID=505250 RepID=UPI00047CFB0B|nr:vWA domain-containing protein [Maribacter antarcticus]
MHINTVFFIVVAAILSVVVVYFQYYFRGKHKGRLRILLSVLRYIGIFGILLLLINPKFSKVNYILQKPNLALLIDNSSSIQDSGKKVKDIVSALINHPELSDRFDITSYQFGKSLRPLDSLSFLDVQTNIQQPLATLADVYARKNMAVVLISDGNQNIGRDYTFSNKVNSPPIYTITVGDTTAYEDLSIGPINTNKYAFLNNKYPLETYVSYQGQGTVKAKVAVKVNGASVYSETIGLSRGNNLKNIKTLVTASKIGVKSISVTVQPVPTERNITNNTRITSVEVIDEKTTVALVSDITHPDLGTLKKSIESNKQRQVVILKPSAGLEAFEQADLFILYQPNTGFRKVFKFLEQKRSNVLIISGVHTDFNFLNGIQEDFKIENGYPQQEFFGNLNSGFSKYDITDFDVSDFPPLESDAGPVTFNQTNETLLGISIKGVDMKSPLLTVYGKNTIKKGLLIGEGLWKWRVQSFRNTGDFSNMDTFLGKLIRYLSTNITKNRLNITYSFNYEGSNTAFISATYFDATYVFDSNALIDISVRNKETMAVNMMPMVLKNAYFEADLTNLAPGDYEFSVEVKDENYKETGAFTISNFDLEKQFVSSNYKKMQKLAQSSGGMHTFSSNFEQIATELISSKAFVPTQKSIENSVSLIDFKILLGLIVMAFSLEWFIRKYNGLI